MATGPTSPDGRFGSSLNIFAISVTAALLLMEGGRMLVVGRRSGFWLKAWVVRCCWISTPAVVPMARQLIAVSNMLLFMQSS